MADLKGEEVTVSPIHFKPLAVVPCHIDYKYLLDSAQGLDHSSDCETRWAVSAHNYPMLAWHTKELEHVLRD